MLVSRLLKNNRLSRGFTQAAAAAGKPTKQKVVLFPGHGIGPEITSSVLKIFDQLKCNAHD